jgi:hypothetical protein
VSHEIISSVFIALRDHVSSDEKVLFILEGFVHMDKMSMMMSLLPEDDILVLREVITRLEANSTTDNLSRVTALKKLFLL